MYNHHTLYSLFFFFNINIKQFYTLNVFLYILDYDVRRILECL